MSYTKRTYPKKIAAAANATLVAASKAHRKFIYSVNYLIKWFPEPCIVSRSRGNAPYDWPMQVGLTGGRHLDAVDVRNLTMAIIVRAAASNRPERQYTVQGFLRASKPYWPKGIVINDDWANFLARNCNDPKCMEAATHLEEFVDAYYTKIEALLATYYLESGDRSGRAYIEVLQRRFKHNWSTQNNTIIKADVKADVEATEKVDTTVTFNFNTVTDTHKAPEGV